MTKKIILIACMFIFLFSSLSFASAQLDINLTSAYKLGETSGTTAFDSAGSNDGTYKGGLPTAVSGKDGNAQDLDGTGDYVDTSIKTSGDLDLSSGNEYSFSFWVNEDSSSAWDFISNTNDRTSNGLAIWSTGSEYRVYVGGSNIGLSATSPSNNDWHNVVVTKDSNDNFELYIDGSSKSTVSSSKNGNQDNIHLGASPDGNEEFDGQIDEVYILNKSLNSTEVSSLYNNGNGNFYTDSLALNEPTGNKINQNIDFDYKISPEGNDIINSTIEIYNNGNQVDKVDNTSISGNQSLDVTGKFSTNHLGNFTANVTTYLQNSTDTYSIQTSRSFKRDSEIINESHTDTVYQTENTDYQLNLTIPEGSSLSNEIFEYDGSNSTATSTKLNGQNYSIDFNQDVPIVSGSQNYNYYYTLTGANSKSYSDNYSQSVNNAILQQCSGGTTYLNFTFKDENTQNRQNANISASSFEYWLGDGTVTKNLQYSNDSGINNTKFCFKPDDRNLNVDYEMQYKANDYPQRKVVPDEFLIQNNDIYQETLYLLNSLDGQFVTFQVLNSAEQPIKNVFSKVEREISGTNRVLGSGLTGDDGSVTFWLNPNFAHDFTFEKDNFETFETTLSPTQTEYTINMEGETVNESNDFTKGVKYEIQPKAGDVINESINKDFNVSLNSTFYSLDKWGISLKNGTGEFITGKNSTNSSGGFLNLNTNTGNDEQIELRIFWETNNSVTDVNYKYSIFSLEGTDYSVANFIDRFVDYLDSGLFGLGDFGKALIAIIIIFMVTGLANIKFGVQNEAALSLIAFALTAILDVGFGLIPNIPGAMEHFPTVIMGLFMLGLFIKEATKF